MLGLSGTIHRREMAKNGTMLGLSWDYGRTMDFWRKWGGGLMQIPIYFWKVFGLS